MFALAGSQLSAFGSSQLQGVLLRSVALLALVRLHASSGVVRRGSVGLVLLALRLVTPLACAALLRDAFQFFSHRAPGKLRLVARRSLSAWSAAEVTFLFYFLWYRRALNSQTTTRWQAVMTHSTPEKRRSSMERYLQAITHVCCPGENPTTAIDTGFRDGRLNSAPFSASVQPPGQHRDSNSEASHTGQRFARSFGQNGRNNLTSASLSTNSLQSLLGSLRSSTSVTSIESTENLLKLRDPDENLSDSDVQRLKLIELGGWFTGPGLIDREDPASWLQRGNVEDWIAHYWFRGATPEELRKNPGDYEELGQLVNMVLESAGLADMAEGRNNRIRPYRVITDPLTAFHRPLLLYVATSLFCPFMTWQVMQILGFHRERVGGLSYWKRPPRADIRSDIDIAAPLGRKVPLVFVHGLGLGLVPYYLFIYRLSNHFSGNLYVPEFPFLAMAPWESIPSAREVVAQLQDMLAANRHTSAHFMGHSFGGVVIGWMIKMAKPSVVCTTLMEPACFLVIKSDVLTKVLYGPATTCYQMGIRYFVFRELFTVNLLCRNFFWEQSSLFPEDLQIPALFELASDDHIVQSFFVKRLLEHERAERKPRRRTSKRKSVISTGSSADVRTDTHQSAVNDKRLEAIEIQWCDGFFHGEILGRRHASERLFAKMRQLASQVQRSDDSRV